ncbi:hypothetical protein DPMN_077725 [Dreissena polymorpha]|uniref:RING-type domain-containing protein n=1 Tax=Dreissena polymorpha TaxID=45954 RepID=A0A9D3YPW2_DREPO|nr:hypothetical protein DPMN_077725 [Dreissena polymorpha]
MVVLPQRCMEAILCWQQNQTLFPWILRKEDKEQKCHVVMSLIMVFSGPESLTDFCKSKLAGGAFEFRCTYKGSTRETFCNAKWDFPTVKRMALLTDTEITYFETKINDNYRKACGIKECPKCTSFCSRQRNTDQRVKCPVCSRKDRKNYEFCWFCMNVWRTNGVNQCGNSECSGQDTRLNILKTCEIKEVIGVKCPKIRACPQCGVFIEHVDKCKHIACPCGTKFCFICLKQADEQSRYQCGAHNSKCEVAPVQTEIPSR